VAVLPEGLDRVHCLQRRIDGKPPIA